MLAGMKCEAFPDGIPEEIWTGENPHTEAVDGDGGLRYEPMEDPSQGG